MENFKELSAAKAAVYELLTYPYYKEINAEYIEKLQKSSSLLQSFLKVKDDSDYSQGLSALENALSSDENSDFLAGEFAQLFLVKNINQNIPGVEPVESVYLSPKHMIMQEERDQVLEMYYKECLERNKDFKENEDHISAELMFMYKLNMFLIKSLNEDNQDEFIRLYGVYIEFLQNHLMKWCGKLCDDIIRLTKSQYYKSIAYLTKGFINIDFYITMEYKKALGC